VSYALRGKVLYRYALAAEKRTAISLAIDWNLESFTATLCLTYTQLFALQTDGKVFIIRIPSGSIEMLSVLSRARHYPGLCLYHDCVYVFGGSASNLCDKLVVKDKMWTELSDCIEKRWVLTRYIPRFDIFA